MNYLYIFILIIIVLFIYGLLFKMKNNQIIYSIENFKESNQKFKNKIDGEWTSDNTRIINPNSKDYLISNTITIDTKNNIIKYKNNKIPITNISNNIINAQNKEFNIYINVNNKYLNEKILNNDYKTASFYDFNKKKGFYIFKLNRYGKISNKVKYIIENDLIQLSIPGSSYSKNNIDSITNFRYNLNNIFFDYININSQNVWDKKSIELIKDKYFNQLNFKIINVFKFTNGQYKFSSISPEKNLLFEKNEDVPFKLVYNINDDLEENKLMENFNKIIIFIFIYKNTGETVGKPNVGKIMIDSKDELKLKNEMDYYFNGQIGIPDLKNVSQNVFLKYNLEIFDIIFTLNNTSQEFKNKNKNKYQINYLNNKQINIPSEILKNRLLNKQLYF